MRVIIVDDEPAAITVLSSLISTYEDVNIVGSFTNPLEAIEQLKNIKPEVVFLDIEMGQVNGLEIAEYFYEHNVLDIVFVTAYSQYAVHAFEVNAIDYLLKPVQKRRLDKTIARLRKRIKGVKKVNDKPQSPNLYISSLGRFTVSNKQGKMNWRTQKAKELFAYLWVHGEISVNKYAIMEDVFPDRPLSSASTLLHTTIYQLRKGLETLGFPSSITFSNESYRLKIETKSDAESLYILSKKQNLGHKDIKTILKFYRGDFLGEEGYSWALGIQEGIRNLTLNMLKTYVIDQMDKREFNALLKDCLSLMINIDPFNDMVIALNIKYLGLQNKRHELKNFFKEYKDKLLNDMGIKPNKDIIALYQNHIRV